MAHPIHHLDLVAADCRAELAFANEAVDFSAELLEGPTFEDRDALVAYGRPVRQGQDPPRARGRVRVLS